MTKGPDNKRKGYLASLKLKYYHELEDIYRVKKKLMNDVTFWYKILETIQD